MPSTFFSLFALFSLLILQAHVSKSSAYENIAMVTSGSAERGAVAGQIAVYWGTDYREGTLSGTCSSANYDIVIIAFLSKFGSGREPELSLGGHCDSSNGGCQRLANEVRFCQRRGIKVLLSIGGPSGGYSISGTDDAKAVSDYLWNAFLGGSKSFRPFGSAVLDGIDFDIRGGKGNASYHDVVTLLAGYNKQGKKVYLSVSSPCLYPPQRLCSAIGSGLVDYAWVQFYNVYGSPDQCEYDSANETLYMEAWNWWSSMPIGKLFFGALASFDAGLSGFIPPDAFTSRVLPFIKGTEKYGGVMVWNKWQDDQNGYASSIKTSV